ncbi:putative uracil-DNA glycosylase [Namao virus]|nr:putative uracil-DNA glycosylase [Namao virus]
MAKLYQKKLDSFFKPVNAVPAKKAVDLDVPSEFIIHESWNEVFKDEFEKPYFKILVSFLRQDICDYTVYPPLDKIFFWTHCCNPDDIKVVILGQDPYHGPGQAHGLSFSVSRPNLPPPSLKNIFKELQADVKNFSAPDHGELIKWSHQGVLLLNTVLTVRAGCPNSHADQGWEQFTDSIIRWINDHLDHVVFLLWGACGKKKSHLISYKKHCILMTSHPSPFSVHRGFFGCKHFSKANDFLRLHGKKPIDWTLV